jgi:hypothetical protein
MPSPRRIRLPLALSLALLACDQGGPPTDPDIPAAATAEPTLASVESSADLVANAAIVLPVNQSSSSSAIIFGLTQTGTGPTGFFKIANAGNSQTALLGQTNGTGNAVRGLSTGAGRAGLFEITNAASGQDALLAKTNGTGNVVHAVATGTGSAAKFENTSAANGGNAVYAFTAGSGNAISAVNTGTGPAGLFTVANPNNGSAAVFGTSPGSGSGVQGRATGNGRGGSFENTSPSNGVAAVFGRTYGIGGAANFVINNPNNFGDAAYIYTDGHGWAGHFVAASATGKGVIIETRGGAGLQVVGGSKNAVVATTTGARALYTEESSEVWFTDYGFGRLDHGRARILLEPVFAQTVNPATPYHVFVQPYGNAELYVSERTPLGFVVQLRAGDPDAEFSYRVVARRLGFEDRRLERAPWADQTAVEHR